MRIPALDGPKVESRPVATAYSNTNFDTGHEAVTQGLNNLGQGLGQAGQVVERVQAEAKHKADTVAANNLVSETANKLSGELHGSLEQDPTIGTDPTNPEEKRQSPTGFLSTRGVEAHAKSAETYSRLERMVEEQAGKTNNPEQREMYLSSAKPMLDRAREQIEGHVAQQTQVAEADSLKARKVAVLNAIGLNFTDEKGAEEQLQHLELPLRNLATSPEDATADMNAVRAAAAKVRIGKYLEAGQWSGAQAIYDRAEPLLGEEGVRLQQMITDKRKGFEQDQQRAKTEALVLTAIDGARAKDGYVDENKALAEVNKVPEARREQARSVMRAQLAVEAEKKKNDIEGWGNSALMIYNRGGLRAIPSELLDKLNTYDPKFVQGLQRDEHTRTRERTADDAAARRAQSDRYDLALKTFMGSDPEVRATTNIDKVFLGYSLNPTGLAGLKAQQQKDIQTVKKGQQVGESAFVKDAMAKVEGSFSANNKAEPKEFEAEARIAYGQAQRENKDEPPNQTQLDAAIARLVAKRVTVTPGRLWGTNRTETPEWKARAEERRKAIETGKAPTIAADLTIHVPTLAAPTTGKVRVVGPNGKSGLAPAEGVDAWLSSHKGWTRQ